MKKYYDNLDDYYDTSRSPMLDRMEQLLQGIFVLVGPAMAGLGLFLLIKQYLGW